MELKTKAFKHSCCRSKGVSFNQHAIKILSLIWTKFGLPITEKFKLLKQRSPPPPNPLPFKAAKWNQTIFQKSRAPPPLLQHQVPCKAESFDNPGKGPCYNQPRTNCTGATTENHVESHQNMYMTFVCTGLPQKKGPAMNNQTYHINSNLTTSNSFNKSCIQNGRKLPYTFTSKAAAWKIQLDQGVNQHCWITNKGRQISTHTQHVT